MSFRNPALRLVSRPGPLYLEPMTSPTQNPPGWYPDPDGLPGSRYWDGTAWTDQTGPPAGTGVMAAPKPTVDELGQPISPSSRLVAILLCWVVGIFGVHRFYVGKIGTGLAMLFTLGGLGIWVIIDLILIAVGSFRDKENRRLLNWS